MTAEILQKASELLQKTLDFLKTEFRQLQTGRASAGLVEELKVEAYGVGQPLKALAQIAVPDATSLTIQPFDRSIFQNIEKAIRDAELGLNPVNNGVFLRIVLPPMTEERRKELTKVVHRFAEEARIRIRQTRQEAHQKLKEAEKAKLISEDELRRAEKSLQEKVDDANKKVEELAGVKEKEVMGVS